jgi:hypothetical protein
MLLLKIRDFAVDCSLEIMLLFLISPVVLIRLRKNVGLGYQPVGQAAIIKR